MSSKHYRETTPLPEATLKALAFVYRSRGLSERRLAKAIGTTHPHVGRIMAGKSRPSKVLAYRLGWSMGLPPEFTTLLVEQSSEVGRKMRYPDGFDALTYAGHTPCPLEAAHGNRLMHEALEVASEFKAAKALYAERSLEAIGLVPTMGAPDILHGSSLDPWHEFSKLNATPLVVWGGPLKAPRVMLPDMALEFIDTIDPETVVRCTHHERP